MANDTVLGNIPLAPNDPNLRRTDRVLMARSGVTATALPDGGVFVPAFNTGDAGKTLQVNTAGTATHWADTTLNTVDVLSAATRAGTNVLSGTLQFNSYTFIYVEYATNVRVATKTVNLAGGGTSTEANVILTSNITIPRAVFILGGSHKLTHSVAINDATGTPAPEISPIRYLSQTSFLAPAGCAVYGVK